MSSGWTATRLTRDVRSNKTKTNDNKATFSRCLGGQSARRAGAGRVGSLSSRRNAADGRPDACPEGASRGWRLGVAVLGKGWAIPCGSRL